jgi:hypothetical protein
MNNQSRKPPHPINFMKNEKDVHPSPLQFRRNELKDVYLSNKINILTIVKFYPMGVFQLKRIAL